MQLAQNSWRSGPGQNVQITREPRVRQPAQKPFRDAAITRRAGACCAAQQSRAQRLACGFDPVAGEAHFAPVQRQGPAHLIPG